MLNIYFSYLIPYFNIIYIIFKIRILILISIDHSLLYFITYVQQLYSKIPNLPIFRLFLLLNKTPVENSNLTIKFASSSKMCKFYVSKSKTYTASSSLSSPLSDSSGCFSIFIINFNFSSLLTMSHHYTFKLICNKI